MTDVLLISDLHIGRKTPSYNVRQFHKRFHNIVRKVRTIGKRQSARRLIVALLGDIIDGEAIYSGQHLDTEVSVIEMVNIAVNALQKAYQAWKSVYDEVRYLCVYGNHGRMHKQLGKSANWDTIVYQRLQDRIGETVHVADNWWLTHETDGFRMFLMHGDNIRMYQQVPYYGIVQRAIRLGKYNLICLGHFHMLYYLRYNEIHIFGNGTMLTDDEYGLRFGLTPGNAFWMFELSEGQIRWMMPISTR